MNLNWDSLLEPIFLFILSLIAGTLWVIIPNPRQHPQAQVTPAPTIQTASLNQPAAAAPTPAAEEAFELRAKSTELGTIVNHLQQQSLLTKRELEQLQAQNQRSLAQIEREKQTLQKLEAQVRSLENQSSHRPGDSDSPAKAIKEITAENEALRKVLAEKVGEAGRLQAQLETTKARPESEILRVPKATPANKLPVLLELIHNRAVPVNKQFYRKKFALLGPTVSERRSEGETITEIHDPDSAFNQMLEKIHPDKQYISCLLNSDSFPIFREVRRLARAKHIDLGWEPMDTSSGKIILYPVHLTKKVKAPKANEPRVPAIMR